MGERRGCTPTSCSGRSVSRTDFGHPCVAWRAIKSPLSQQEPVAFAAWLLDICLDQARFMRELLTLGSLKPRLQELLLYLSARPWPAGGESSVVKVEALEALLPYRPNLPRIEGRARSRPLRRQTLSGLASPRHRGALLLRLPRRRAGTRFSPLDRGLSSSCAPPLLNATFPTPYPLSASPSRADSLRGCLAARSADTRKLRLVATGATAARACCRFEHASGCATERVLCLRRLRSQPAR
jgi:hypothetical protein